MDHNHHNHDDDNACDDLDDNDMNNKLTKLRSCVSWVPFEKYTLEKIHNQNLKAFGQAFTKHITPRGP